jgi:pimeloyl-ACP methyl ester carboxylesterase
VPLLRERGHAVVTPTLRGLGADQAHLSPGITLHQHIEDVCAELRHLQDEVVLVGHSYAGMIVTGALEATSASVRHIVYLDAFIPEDGQCVLDLLPEKTGNYFREVAREHGDGWRLPGGEGQLDLWGLKAGETREFVRARLCDFSLRCFEQPVRLPANRKAHTPATYVSCVAESYPAKPFFEPFANKARELGWQVVEMNTGHDCHVEQPQEVAKILLSAAGVAAKNDQV